MWQEVVQTKIKTDLQSDYELGEVLGKGSFGVVRLATDRHTGQVCACKAIAKARLLSPEKIEDMRREVEILHLLTPHDQITNLLGVYEDPKAIYLVMELCQGGELFDRIIQRKHLSEAIAARYLGHMVTAVAHCHGCGVMHRDIKPENFLLSDPSDEAVLKACDFGLSTFYRPDEALADLVGSPYYIAPEVLRRRYGPEADIWSLGVVLYILLSGFPPFWGDTQKDMCLAILRGLPRDWDEAAPWPSISPAAKDVIRRALTVDPGERITLTELMCHPWLKDHGVASCTPLDSLVVTRMRQFAGMNKVRKAAILAAAQHLSHEQIRGLRELFKMFDANDDGMISLDELRQGLVGTGSAALTEQELEEILVSTDVDGSGALDYNEFLAATVNVRLLQREEVLMQLFEELDVDKSGTLSLEEIEAALGRKTLLGPIDREEVLDFMRRADAKRDGEIDFEEFVAAWRNSGSGGALQAAKSLRRGLSTVTLQDMDIDTRQPISA